MAKSLKSELESCGCTIGEDRFHDLIRATYYDMFGDMSDEILLCDPDTSIEFCEAIRDRTSPGVKNQVILRDVINLRKRCRLKINADEATEILRRGEKNAVVDANANGVKAFPLEWWKNLDRRLTDLELIVSRVCLSIAKDKKNKETS